LSTGHVLAGRFVEGGGVATYEFILNFEFIAATFEFILTFEFISATSEVISATFEFISKGGATFGWGEV
jgi:hypothetical protein